MPRVCAQCAPLTLAGAAGHPAGTPGDLIFRGAAVPAGASRDPYNAAPSCTHRPIRERLNWEISPDGYQTIRRLWIEHSRAEDGVTCRA